MEITSKQMDALVTKINEHCGVHCLGKFIPMGKNGLHSYINIADIVILEGVDFPTYKESVIALTIAANKRIIALMESTNQKLEELKKELKHG